MQHEGETWYVCKTKHGGDLTIKFCPQGGGVDILNCQIPTTSPPAATLGGWGVSLIPAAQPADRLGITSWSLWDTNYPLSTDSCCCVAVCSRESCKLAISCSLFIIAGRFFRDCAALEAAFSTFSLILLLVAVGIYS